MLVPTAPLHARRHPDMLFDSTILDDLSAGISHIGSLQAQRAIQTRWWHHSQVLQGQSIVWHDSRVQYSAYFPSLTHCSAVLEGVVRFYNGRGTAVMFVTMKPTRGRRDGHGHRRTVRLHHARRPARVPNQSRPFGKRTPTQPDTSRDTPRVSRRTSARLPHSHSESADELVARAGSDG